MTAETILALFLAAVVLAFLSGEMYGREQERQKTRRRVDKIRRTYTTRPWRNTEW